MAQKNPIEKRLEKLSDQWGEFTQDPNARILVWQIRADEGRMIDAFIAKESDERCAEHPDVFQSFDVAFENPAGHGYLLRADFVKRYREGSEAIAAQGVATDWQAPPAYDGEHDIPFLIRTCESFHAHYKLPGAFVLVLRPSAVSDPHAYQVWLHQLALKAPAHLRAIALDDVAAPGYSALIQSDPKRVMARTPDLDMPGALEELSKAAGNLDTPGGKYRDLFVRIGTSLGKKDLATALQLGDLALAIAAAQGWFHMAVPIQFACAAGLGQAGRLQEAVARYLAAEASAAEGEDKGPDELKPTCKQLRMQARLGRGSTLIAGGAWGMAAQCFEETAPLAAELGDQRSTLDCFRLASFSYEQKGEHDKAWDRGMQGMRVTREMDEETRKTSTFPYLGEGMMRLCETGQRRGLGPQMEREIVALAGTRDWRPKPVAAPPVQAAHGPAKGGAA